MTAADKLADLIAANVADKSLAAEMQDLIEAVEAEKVSEVREHLGARLAKMDEGEARACHGPASRNDDTMVGIMAGIRFAGELVADEGFDY